VEGIENMIVQALLTNGGEIFGVKTPFFTTSNNIYQISTVLNSVHSEKHAIEYPFMYLSLTSAGVNSQSYNPHVLLRRGMYGEVDETGNSVTKYPILPIQYQFVWTYITQSQEELFSFLRRWLFASQSKGLNFSLTYAGIRLDIKVILSPTLEVPTKDALADTVNVYVYQGEMEVYGYSVDVGNTTDVPMLKQKPIFAVTPV